jgi:hypothetical protein
MIGPFGGALTGLTGGTGVPACLIRPPCPSKALAAADGRIAASEEHRAGRPMQPAGGRFHPRKNPSGSKWLQVDQAILKHFYFMPNQLWIRIIIKIRKEQTPPDRVINCLVTRAWLYIVNLWFMSA